MRISKILTLSGPNVWSQKRMLEIWLENDLPETPSPPLQIMRDRLKQWAVTPSIEPTITSVQLTRFRQQIENMASPVELFANAALEFQVLAGTPVSQFIVEPAKQSHRYYVVIEIVEDTVGRLATGLAQTIVWPDDGATPDLAECCRRLRDCAREACFGTTTAPIVAAARARGIPVTRLDGDCLLQLGHGARQRRIQGVITGGTSYLAESISRDKVLTKRLMQQLGLPTAQGRLAKNAEDAWAAACEIGLPVVVKPRDADYANGVSVHLVTQTQVVAGWELARQYRTDVLVERHLAGVPHRLLIVNDVLVAAVRRDPAHVVGDGRQTMNELIAAANRDPRRGDGPEFPWFPILIDEKLLLVLSNQGFHLGSIPPAELMVTLQYDPKTCYAEMILDVTDNVHPEVAAAARDAVRVTGLDVAGVDVMAIDITRPLAEQDGGILEVNAGPAIYLHRSPACNPPRPVPEAVVASLIPPHETGRIPIVAVIGDCRSTETAATIGTMLECTGRTVGVSSAAGIRIGRRMMTSHRANDSAGCQALLLNPRVEASVCELSAESIRESGLPFDGCQVAVLTGGKAYSDERLEAALFEKCLRVVVDSVTPDGMVIVNVGDRLLARMFAPGDSRVVAVAESEDHPFLKEHAMRGGTCAFFDDGEFVMAIGDEILRACRAHSDASRAERAGILQLLAVAAAWVVDGNVVNQDAPDALPSLRSAVRRSLPYQCSRLAPSR